jgi:protein phosphatase
MDAARQHEEHIAPLVLTLPRKTLLVLCGPAGSGKSTIARSLINSDKGQGLKETTIVSSDYCRTLICDDENNQRVNRAAFELFYSIIDMRLLQGVFTIADSTALLKDTRLQLLALAQKHASHTCILVFNTSLKTCILRDRMRSRSVGEQVVRYHNGQMLQALQAIPHEGWSQFYLLEEHKDIQLNFIA